MGAGSHLAIESAQIIIHHGHCVWRSSRRRPRSAIGPDHSISSIPLGAARRRLRLAALKWRAWLPLGHLACGRRATWQRRANRLAGLGVQEAGNKFRVARRPVGSLARLWPLARPASKTDGRTRSRAGQSDTWPANQAQRDSGPAGAHHLAGSLGAR